MMGPQDFAWCLMFNYVRHEFQMLHGNVPAGYNWSNQHDETKVNALTRRYKNYYSVKNSAIITDNANDEHLKVQKPEDARTEAEAQKCIILHHLYAHYMLTQAAQHDLAPSPPANSSSSVVPALGD